MTEKRRLGKGLGALIPEVLSGATEISEVQLNKIKPNPYQPRQKFEDEKINELADSITEHGIIQAVVVAPDEEGDGYILIAGERRCRAAKKAGLSSIPAVIKKIDKKAMLEVALIENLQREDLNPIEEAKAYRKLMKEHNYTQEVLAQRLGKSRPSIANAVRLLALPEPVLKMLEDGAMSSGQARPLLSFPDQEAQIRGAKLIIENGLTAREAERLIYKEKDSEVRTSSSRNKKLSDPEQDELQSQIQISLGTKVRIKKGKNGGSIEIYYYNDEDLERLIDKLLAGES